MRTLAKEAGSRRLIWIEIEKVNIFSLKYLLQVFLHIHTVFQHDFVQMQTECLKCSSEHVRPLLQNLQQFPHCLTIAHNTSHSTLRVCSVLGAILSFLHLLAQRVFMTICEVDAFNTSILQTKHINKLFREHSQ